MANKLDSNDQKFQAETKMPREYMIRNTAMPDMTLEITKEKATVKTIVPVTVKPLREPLNDTNTNLDKNFRTEFIQ